MPLPRRTSTAFVVLLAAVTLAGGVLRVAGLGRRGLAESDEAWFLLNARAYAQLPLLLSNWNESDDLGGAIERTYGGIPPARIEYKPGFILPTALVAACAPPGADWPGMAVATAAGLLSIPLLFLLGRRLGLPDAVSLVACAMLAFSPYHVAYSRAGQPLTTAGLALLLYLLASLGPADGRRGPRRVAAGLALAWALACHESLLPLVGILGIWEIGRLGLVRESLGPLSRFALGFFGLILFWEILTTVQKWTLATAGLPVNMSYLEQLVHHAGSRRPGMDLLYFPWLLVRSEGLAWCAALALGGIAVRRAILDRAGRQGVWIVALAPLLVWSLLPFAKGRLIAPSLPAMMLLASAGIGWVVSHLEGSGRTAVHAVAVAAVLAGTAPVAAGQPALRSGYPEAARWLAAQGADGTVSRGSGPILRAYLGPGFGHDVSDPRNAAAEARRLGIEFVVLDAEMELREEDEPEIPSLPGLAPPARLFPNPLGTDLHSLYTHGYTRRYIEERLRRRPHAGTIRIYRIAER